MHRGYRSVLRRGAVLSALVPYVLARLPLTMAPLGLLLLAQSKTGSYHRAGLVVGAYALAVAISGPVLGRMVDRRGQSPVLLASGLVHAAAMCLAGYAGDSGWYGVLLGSAFVAGASLPPVAACMRALWTRLLPDEDERTAGYAIEGIIVEVAELSGPVLISLLLVLGRPANAVSLAGALMGVAAIAFRSSRASREAPRSTAPVNRWGPLGLSGVRRLLIVVASSTATIGAVEVAITAYARRHGGLASAGLYIGLISVGGVVAGAFFGSSERLTSRRGPRMLAVVLLAAAAAAAGIGAARTPWLVLICLFAFGAAVAVGVVLQLATMGLVATEHVRTEAFTWGGTANFIGLGAGTAAAGWAVDHGSLASGFLLAAAPSVLAAVVTLVSGAHFAAPAAPEVEVSPAEEAAAEEAAAEETIKTPAEISGGLDSEPVQPAVAALAEEVAALRAHVTDLEAALRAALEDSPSMLVADARERARRMLDRADAACLEIRDRATDDAERVRSAATTASIEVLAATERDARAMLERARREADGIISRARRTAANVDVPARAALTALPGGDADEGDQAAAGSG